MLQRAYVSDLSNVSRSQPDNLFDSFWIAGFESACHVNSLKERVDMTAGVQHDTHALSDYLMLREVGIRTVRDGLRWPLIDHGAALDFTYFAVEGTRASS